MTPSPDDADDGTDAVLEMLATVYGLKDESRTGWVLRGVESPESVAAHSWGVCLLVLQFADAEGVDPDRALRMAVVHDLPEAIVGDVAVRADPAAQAIGPEEKLRREEEAMTTIAAALGSPTGDLWAAYEAGDTPEARFVKDMDLIDMCLQALYYERRGRYDPTTDTVTGDAYDNLEEFFATAEPRVSTATGQALFEAIKSRYAAAVAGR